VLHPKNAGYFEYFDGTRWVKKANVNVYEITSVWQDKVKECFDLLGERHGDAWLKSFQALFAANVIQKLKNRFVHSKSKRFQDMVAKRDALLAVDNANSRIKAVESHTGKKVRRVFSGDEGEARKRKVHRNVMWAELMK